VMPIFRFCSHCKDFVNAKLIHQIQIEKRNMLNFFECPECDNVWIGHDQWTEEDEE